MRIFTYVGRADRKEMLVYSKAAIKTGLVGLLTLGRYRANYHLVALDMAETVGVNLNDDWRNREFLYARHRIVVYIVESLARLIDGLVGVLSLGLFTSYFVGNIVFSDWAEKYED